MCFRQCRSDNLQGTKFDHFNMKSWNARANMKWMKKKDKDIFTISWFSS